jgi:hypothetical protein
MTRHVVRDGSLLRRPSLIAATALTALTAGLAAAPAADAGTYTVLGCRDRADTPVAASDASGGWRPTTSAVADGLRSGDTCLTDGMLYSDVGGAGDFGTSPVFSGWAFAAPDGTAITGYLLDWEGWGANGGTSGDLLINGDQPTTFEQYDHAGTIGRHTSVRSNLDETQISVVARCIALSQHCGQTWYGGNAWLSLYRTEVTLRDAASPSAGAASGTAVSHGTWRAGESLTFNATDRGAGVQSVIVRADGREILRQRVAEGHCTEAAPGVYLSAVPCPSSASPEVTVDTTTLTEGDHAVRFVVVDAAGNETTVYDATKLVDNVPPPTNSQAPTVSGYADVGERLTAQTGAWDAHGATGLTFLYQWQSCGADGSGCADIPGATAAGRTLVTGDVGRRLRVVVTGRTGEGATAATSDVSPVVRERPSAVVAYTPNTQPGPTPQARDSADSGTQTGDTRGAPNGDNASDRATLTAAFASSRSKSLTTSFGKRAVIRGRLVDAGGAGIRNARIELVATNAMPGATAVDKGGARTRQDGGWTLILPANVASRTLTFRYRSHLADERPIAEVELRLRVRAGLTLHVTPRHTHNRGTVRFSGKLLGSPVPQRGKLIELQARGRGGGRWLTFKTIRTSSRGAFHARYTFHATYGAVTYEFRARAREDSSYPYLTGVSKRARVRVS